MRILIAAFAIVVILCTADKMAAGQDDFNARLQNVTQRVSDLETKEHQLMEQREVGGGLAFLFEVFCALWAQNTNRSAWLWFFLGVFFNVITVIFLLYKNSRDRRLAVLNV
jgi:hypothetical protein